MKRLAWICAIALVLAAAARAAEVSLEAMTSVELRAAVAAGTTTALIPIGGFAPSLPRPAQPAPAPGKCESDSHFASLAGTTKSESDPTFRV